MFFHERRNPQWAGRHSFLGSYMAFSIDQARNQFVGPNIEPDPKIFTLQNCLPLKAGARQPRT
jgi:hypothetical protein